MSVLRNMRRLVVVAERFQKSTRIIPAPMRSDCADSSSHTTGTGRIERWEVHPKVWTGLTSVVVISLRFSGYGRRSRAEDFERAPVEVSLAM